LEEGVPDGSAIDLTLRAITAAGERSWLHIVGKRVEDATGARLIGVIQDVTEQRSAVDALAQSEARYRHLFETQPTPEFTAKTQSH
jgi:PAS domain-containing protein